MRKLTILLVLGLALLAAAAVYAADKDAAKVPEGDHAAQMAKMDGKDLYKNICRSCHGPDADAGEYTPMALIMDQWDEFFADTFTDSHKDVVCPQDKTKKVTDIFTPDMLKKVQKFCVDHAADSEQPMTCG